MPRADLYHDLVARGLASERGWTHKAASSPHPFLLLSSSPKHTGPLLFLHVRDSSKVIGNMCPKTLAAVARWGAHRAADGGKTKVTDAMHVVYFGGEGMEVDDIESKTTTCTTTTTTSRVQRPQDMRAQSLPVKPAQSRPPTPHSHSDTSHTQRTTLSRANKPGPIVIPVSRSTPLLSPDSFSNPPSLREDVCVHMVASGSSVSLATTASRTSSYVSSRASLDYDDGDDYNSEYDGEYNGEYSDCPYDEPCGAGNVHNAYSCGSGSGSSTCGTTETTTLASETMHVHVHPSTPPASRTCHVSHSTPSSSHKPLPRTSSPTLLHHRMSLPTTCTPTPKPTTPHSHTHSLSTPSTPPTPPVTTPARYSYQHSPAPYPAPTPAPAPILPRGHAHAPISHRDGICIHYIRGLDARISKRTDKDVYEDINEVIRECFGRTGDLREFDIRLARRWWKMK